MVEEELSEKRVQRTKKACWKCGFEKYYETIKCPICEAKQ